MRDMMVGRTGRAEGKRHTLSTVVCKVDVSLCCFILSWVWMRDRTRTVDDRLPEEVTHLVVISHSDLSKLWCPSYQRSGSPYHSHATVIISCGGDTYVTRMIFIDVGLMVTVDTCQVRNCECDCL